MRSAFLLLLIICLHQICSAQSSLKGSVLDTLGRKALPNAVVSLVQKKDSCLYKFSRTNAGGQFSFDAVAPGEYIMLVTYPKFADYADELKVNPGANDLGTIPLTLKSALLDAVVIRSAAAIRIKGDTTEFAADSFKVREGATVEELLRRLPGFQVNSKGEITAQGRKVQKVLVDGEEFFGDDPTMATQNIAAKAVDKVQVFDAKTESQKLTGLSTGEEGKTVNIKLKEDFKKGSFGKLTFGSDYSKFLDAKAMYNQFKASKKVSVYGTRSNVSTGSLDWQDRNKLGMDEEAIYDELGGFYMIIGGGDEFNDWSLKGLPNSHTVGGLYNNKWNNGKNSLNTSYTYNSLGTSNIASNLTQNILPGQLSYRNKFQNSDGLNLQHRLSGKYEWKLDSFATLKLTAAVKKKTISGTNNINSEFLNEAKQFINQSRQTIANESEQLQNNTNLIFTRLFRKKGRVWSTNLQFSLTDDKQTSIVDTKTDFYKNNNVDSVDIADQQKKLSGMSQTILAKTTFSEPLSTKLAFIFDYTYSNNSSNSYRNTYNKDITGKYATLDKPFSSNFDMDAFSHAGTGTFRYTDKKLNGSVGMGLSDIQLNLVQIDSNNKRNYNFLNLTPQVSLNYLLRPQERINFNYRGTTRQPSINQLQPLRENTDRLNIQIGNPDLKVGFNHTFGINYNASRTLSQKYYYFSATYTIPVNAITMITNLDLARGKQTTMPVNINGNRNWRFSGDYSKEGKEKKLGYSVYLSGSGGKSINFVNADKNVTTYVNTDFTFNLSYSLGEGGYVSFGPTAGYNISESSLQKNFNNNYWNYGGSLYGNVKLPWKLILNTDFNASLREKLPGLSNNPNQINWNATVSKIVKKDGKISLVAYDILNQNTGFTRNIQSNFYSEDRHQRVGQYFLLRFEWSFNTMPVKN
jgi:hypothetical protein